MKYFLTLLTPHIKQFLKPNHYSMNKYIVEIPLSCSSNGAVKGIVFANSREEADSMISDVDDLDDFEYLTTETNDTLNIKLSTIHQILLHFLIKL